MNTASKVSILDFKARLIATFPEIKLIWDDDRCPNETYEYNGPLFENHEHIIAQMMAQLPPDHTFMYVKFVSSTQSHGPTLLLYWSFKPRLSAILQLQKADEKQTTFDFAKSLMRDTIDYLLDGHGSVSLIDFHPRIVPVGYTPEYLIVRAARTSLGAGLKSPTEDAALLNYLYVNKHTSPLEMCNVTLRLQIPLVLMTQFLRHRSAKHCKVNIFSQRYAEVTDELPTYNPLKYAEGIRGNGGMLGNKQSSTTSFEANRTEIIELMETANAHQKATEDIYHKMIKAKLAPEIARFWLSNAQYTQSILQLDLNNLLHLLHLRDDHHAQQETQVFAHAIYELCKPLFPTIFAAFDNERHGLSMTRLEVETMAKHSTEIVEKFAVTENAKNAINALIVEQHKNFPSKSRTEKEAFAQKSKRLRTG